MYTAVLQLIICILARYEKDKWQMTGIVLNAFGGKVKKKIKKEERRQLKKSLPTLSADLNYVIDGSIHSIMTNYGFLPYS